MSRRDSGPEEKESEASEESFLERWSRRKQQSRQADTESPDPADGDSDSLDEAAVPAEHEAAAADETAPPEAALEEPEPEPPGDEDMPPLDSIDRGGSVSDFFSPRVSAGLRRAALRRLFAQPEISNLEVLDDYAEDFSKYKALGNIVTADMRHRAEVAAKRLARKAAESLESRPADELAGAVETPGEAAVDPDTAPDTRPLAETSGQAEPAAKPSTPESDTTEEEDDNRPA